MITRFGIKNSHCVVVAPHVHLGYFFVTEFLQIKTQTVFRSRVTESQNMYLQRVQRDLFLWRLLCDCDGIIIDEMWTFKKFL